MTKGLQKILVILFGVLIVCLVIFGVYKIFFDKGTTKTFFKRDFVLTEMSGANVEDEAYVKLIGISDERCKEEVCDKEGQMVAKVLIINNHAIKYVKLGTLVDNSMDLDKLGYMIELIDINETEVTLKLSRLE